MIERTRFAVAAAVCLVVGCSVAGCGTSQPFVNQCAPLFPARYSFGLTYDGEYTFDGGCPSAHVLDGQSVTLELDGQGGGTLTTAMQTLSCWAMSDGAEGVNVHCPVPPTDQVVIGLNASCDDSGVGASVFYLVDVYGPSDALSAACTETYLPQ